MFKAKLIEKSKYYYLKRIGTIIFLLYFLLLGLISFNHLPSWTIFILYLMMNYFIYKNMIKTSAVSDKRKIELDLEFLTIRSNNGEKTSNYSLKNLSKIKLKKEYEIAKETIVDTVKEFKGEYKGSYIIIEHDNKEERFDFLIDSYYMIEELKKLSGIWQEKGFNIEYL